MNHLDGTVALVTGGAGGLGSAVSRRLCDQGASVVVFDFATGPAEALADELGDRAVAVTGDATTDDAVLAALDAAAGLGTLRHVVCCAGGGRPGQRTVARDGTPHDLGLFTETFELNVVTTFNVLRHAASAMAKNEPLDDGARGSIVLTSSIAGYEGQIGTIAYSAAKAAINGMTLVAARDLAASGIRVNAIAPGTMGTSAWDQVSDEIRGALEKKVPFPSRFGQPEEFAALAEHLLVNSYVNGEVIRLDGAIRFDPR